MLNYPLFTKKMFSFFSDPSRGWFVQPGTLESLTQTMLGQAKAEESGKLRVEDDYLRKQYAELDRKLALQTDPKIPGLAVLEISGVIYHGASIEEEYWFGVYNTERIFQAAAEVKKNPQHKMLLLVINSPGGVATALPEAAAALRGISASGNPVIAYTSQLTASAAYWLAAAADQFHASPFAEIGSIGVYSAIVDLSKYYEQMGVKIEYIRDGKYKAMGAPGKGWTEDERQLIVDRVEKISSQFKGFVQANRPAVTAAQMQGQVFAANDPEASGLVDSAKYSTLADFLGLVSRSIKAL